MKESKIYREQYQKLREEMIEEITNAVLSQPTKSLSLADVKDMCIIESLDDQESIVAMGIDVDNNNRIMIQAGVYDPTNFYNLRDIWYDCLVSLYENVEEALKDPQPFEGY